MLRDRNDFRTARPAFALLLGLMLAAAGRPAAETVREMESERGTVRIAIVALEAPAPPAPGDGGPLPAPPDPEAPGDSLHPVLAIADFTSLGEMAREAEALLQVRYYDKAAREELRFPLKYSELRRYLRDHPLDYREGTLEERNVALLGDLARAWRIKMLAPAEMGGKP